MDASAGDPHGTDRQAGETIHGGSVDGADSGNGAKSVVPGTSGSFTLAVGSAGGAGDSTGLKPIPNNLRYFPPLHVSRLNVWRLVIDDHLLPELDTACESGGILVGELVGWRLWRTKNGMLQSLYQDTVWGPRKAMHGMPTLGRRNGIHSFKERATAETTFQYAWQEEEPYRVLGSVLMWGDVIQHELGYRAEYAKVHTIDDIITLEGGERGKGVSLLAELRQTYGVSRS